jgi:hypothetical protein
MPLALLRLGITAIILSAAQLLVQREISTRLFLTGLKIKTLLTNQELHKSSMQLLNLSLVLSTHQDFEKNSILKHIHAEIEKYECLWSDYNSQPIIVV